jgi:hypothetical protein
VTQVVNDTRGTADVTRWALTTPANTATGVMLGASGANNDPLTYSVVAAPTFGPSSGQALNLLTRRTQITYLRQQHLQSE